MTFAHWHDRLILALVLLAGLAVVRSWIADQPGDVARSAAFAASAVGGMGAGRLVTARLAFHACEGLLATDALHPRTGRRYVAALHGIGCTPLAAITLIGRPSLLAVSLPGYMAGVLVSGLVGRFRMPVRLARSTRLGGAVAEWSHRPGAGLAAAVILLTSPLAARSLGPDTTLVVAGIETVVLAPALTPVDHGTVVFMGITGHGALRTVVYHAKGLAALVAVVLPGCWIELGFAAAGIIAAAFLATAVLCLLRVLAYRLHGKRAADLVVSIFAALLSLTAFLAPLALPAVALALLWQLQRRARTKTWLLA